MAASLLDPPEPPPRHVWRWVGLTVLILVLIVDMGYFRIQIQRFGLEAKKGLEQLSGPVVPGEAIVVLTGDRRRIPKAIEILRTRQSPWLLISGTQPGVTLTDLVNEQGDSTVQIHETWAKITIESKSESTIENAIESAKRLREKEVDLGILVTSDYHMVRASRIFKEAMPEIDWFFYPVLSDVTEFKFRGMWLFLAEYAKFRLYTLHLMGHPD